MSSEKENIAFGVDLRTWVREGLIDTLVPYSSAPAIDSKAPSWTDPRSAEFFLALTRGTPCRLALNIMPRSMTPEDYKRRAHGLYQAGAENLFFWDSYTRTNYDPDPGPRSSSRLGHKAEVADWPACGGLAGGEAEAQAVQARRLGSVLPDAPG